MKQVYREDNENTLRISTPDNFPQKHILTGYAVSKHALHSYEQP